MTVAMFLLVGKELVKAQESAENDPNSREVWKYTHNWIAYEVGLACQQDKDVWVICDDVSINFPVPYLTHYSTAGIHREDPNNIEFWKHILANYLQKIKPPRFFQINCPYDDCKAYYELRTRITEKGSVICPTCPKANFIAERMAYKRSFEKIEEYYSSIRGFTRAAISSLINKVLE